MVSIATEDGYSTVVLRSILFGDLLCTILNAIRVMYSEVNNRIEFQMKSYQIFKFTSWKSTIICILNKKYQFYEIYSTYIFLSQKIPGKAQKIPGKRPAEWV